MRTLFVAMVSVLLLGCEQQAPEEKKEIIRGLKTVLIKEQQKNVTRFFPSVLSPSETTALSFQISGQLGANRLNIGQRVKAGEKLLELEQKSLELAVKSAQASLNEAEAAAKNANNDLKRKQQLGKDGVISETTLENAKTQAQGLAAQVDQAQSQLETARDNLAKSKLLAPYDGVINSIQVKSFSTVAAGSPVVTLYNPNGFEAKFSVAYQVLNHIAIGKSVTIRLADNPKITMKGRVKELASSTTTVSSYPVIVELQQTHPSLKAGMAIEVSMDFEIAGDEGSAYSIPLTALLTEGRAAVSDNNDPEQPLNAKVFVFQADSQTVVKREVLIGGIKENEVLIIQGLQAGERVASAGVAFLREGQKVMLLEQKR